MWYNAGMRVLTKISVIFLLLWLSLLTWQICHLNPDIIFFGKGQSFYVLIDPLTPVIMPTYLDTYSRHVSTIDSKPGWFFGDVHANGCILGFTDGKLTYQHHNWYIFGYYTYYDGPKIDHYEIWFPVLFYLPLIVLVASSILPLRWLIPRVYRKRASAKALAQFAWTDMRWYAISLRWTVILIALFSLFFVSRLFL